MSAQPNGPTLFYLFAEGDSIEIRPLTENQANEVSSRGFHWLGMPQTTLSDAQALRLALLHERTRHPNT
jgi:hypothetical protein